ncbi:transcriptional regulator [candidate division WOR-3 bacterium]|nr:transcriptional regulator [candidate division WOR-3 bacterium]
MADSVELILDAFRKAGKPLKAGEAADMAGVDTKEAGKIIKKLQEEGRLISPKRCFYGLP